MKFISTVSLECFSCAILLLHFKNINTYRVTFVGAFALMAESAMDHVLCKSISVGMLEETNANPHMAFDVWSLSLMKLCIYYRETMF